MFAKLSSLPPVCNLLRRIEEKEEKGGQLNKTLSLLGSVKQQRYPSSSVVHCSTPTEICDLGHGQPFLASPYPSIGRDVLSPSGRLVPAGVCYCGESVSYVTFDIYHRAPFCRSRWLKSHSCVSNGAEMSSGREDGPCVSVMVPRTPGSSF